MRSKKIEEHKKLLRLTDRQRSILVGTILGDGHLESLNGGRTFRLKVEHSKKQSFYVDWLYDEFKDWALTPPKVKPKKLNDKIFENYYFQTLSVGQFRFYGKLFYKFNLPKSIPKNIDKLLTPLALAVWFMDDGSYKSKNHRAVILNTQGFSEKDINILIESFFKKFGLKANIRIQKDGLQIIIVGQSAQRFYEIVKPYVLPNFHYKFGALINTLPKEYRRRSKVS